MEPIIEIKNLTHIYSPNTPFERRALDQVNLTIYRGEYLGIIGRTGSGKSTPDSAPQRADPPHRGGGSLPGAGHLEQAKS